MAKSTLSIEDRLSAAEELLGKLEERLDKLEGKPGSDWQPLFALVTHPGNPYPRWTLVNQMRCAIESPESSPLKERVHFINTTGRYYVRPIPYLKAIGAQISE